MSALHAARSVWRAVMPTRLRLSAQPLLNLGLENYVRAIASRPHGAQTARGPIRLVGYVSASHGIGGSARLAARAFAEVGATVEMVDVADAVLNWTGRYATPQEASAWVFYLNPPEMLAALAGLGPRQLIGPRYGYWAWELPKAPDRWLKDGRLVDEIWACSHYTAKAFAGARAPVRVVPNVLRMSDYAAVKPAARTAAFQAVTLFDFNSSMARKNPLGTIAAFRAAFGDDPAAKLTIKTQNGDRFPELLADFRARAPDNVEIVDAVWPYEAVKALIAGADVLLSLHRAEGFGLTPAEAMAMGTPVIATAFSGNLDFMDEASAALIPAAQIPVEDPQGIYVGQTWAEPNFGAAVAALRRMREDADWRASLSANGRRMVAERLSPQAWFNSLPANVQAAVQRSKAG